MSTYVAQGFTLAQCVDCEVKKKGGSRNGDVAFSTCGSVFSPVSASGGVGCMKVSGYRPAVFEIKTCRRLFVQAVLGWGCMRVFDRQFVVLNSLRHCSLTFRRQRSNHTEFALFVTSARFHLSRTKRMPAPPFKKFRYRSL